MEIKRPFEVGKPFPLPVPKTEGAVMELWGNGLVVLIQMPGLTRAERQAFEKSFKRYSYLETGTPVPVAVWVFDFPALHGPVDCNFNARLVEPGYIDNYLSLENGQVRNAVVFYLLDRQVLRGIKLVGLEPEAVRMFHATIRKQLGMKYSEAEYNRYLQAVYGYSTMELFEMGTKFGK